MNGPDVEPELTVRELRWILAHADGAGTPAEAREAFAESERQAAIDAAHLESQTRYAQYVERRRERGTEEVARAADEALDRVARSARNPLSREEVALVRNKAADLERVRFDAVEPCLQFAEWVEAGEPAVHRIGDAPTSRLKNKLTGVMP